MDFKDEILQFLRQSPGKTASEIADALGFGRKEISGLLYGSLRSQVRQDKQYRWWLLDEAATKDQIEFQQLPQTPLAKLCRYYLECLSEDDQAGISVFAESKHGSPDYAELRSLTSGSGGFDFVNGEAGRGLISSVSKDRSRLTLCLGFPLRMNKIRSKKGWEGFMVEPVFIIPIPFEKGRPIDGVDLSTQRPEFNFKVLSAFVEREAIQVLEESIQLAEELGLGGKAVALPEWDELLNRLHKLRPGWDWKEQPDNEHLTFEPPVAQIRETGIYNRAAVFVVERSPYTQGLETELKELQSISPERYKGTALGQWLGESPSEIKTGEDGPLIEILPLNNEQRQAVQSGLSKPLSVITGPPGTGKSQAVTSLLINAAWRGKKVLFASKNNKAVDVVEARVNGLGSRPVLLRLGATEMYEKLAEYLASFLRVRATPEDQQEFAECERRHRDLAKQFEAIHQKMDVTVALRNKVDLLDRLLVDTRKSIGEEALVRFREADRSAIESGARRLLRAIHSCDHPAQNLLVRLLWPILKRRRFEKLSERAEASADLLKTLSLKTPPKVSADEPLGQWLEFVSELEKRMSEFHRVQEYFDALEDLSAADRLEDAARELSRLTEEISGNSVALWQTWLRLNPTKISAADRRRLGDFVSLIQLMVQQRESGRRVGAEVYRKQAELFPNVSSLLSCWAVTSLSARGRLPFEPGFFDVVVIDEASQCDIASALPLLYRAKRAVIIGDPKQLKHISRLNQAQDQQLMAKHEIIEHHASWSYSVNSLYDLASYVCSPEDLTVLRDHHRSHAAIINFSNEFFYEGQLRIATNYSRLRPTVSGSPAVRWIDIKGKVVRPGNGGALNEEEAQAVVAELHRLVIEQGYKGTIGIVSPFRAQTNRIRELVNQNEQLSARLAGHDFLAETVHRFQGDERDIMIFSPVVSSGTPSGALGFLRKTPNLFNVAITRARSSLVVIGDKGVAADCGVDYLARFASYVEGLRVDDQSGKARGSFDPGPQYPEVAKPETVSEWEKVLYEALYHDGMRLIPQYSVDKYDLDLALIEGDRRLNIEVDGERYHRDWNGELCRRDQIRNQRLIELGWDVIRFWVYQVRDEMPWCIEQVRQWRDRRI